MQEPANDAEASDLLKSFKLFNTGGRVCRTCKLPKEYLIAVNQLLKENKPIRAIAKWLMSRLGEGVAATYSQVRYHKDVGHHNKKVD